MSVNYSHLIAGSPSTVSIRGCRRRERMIFPTRTGQYVSHTDPSLGWSLDVDYGDDYDPIGDDSDNYPDDLGCYGFLQYDSHNGVWWIQSHIQGTVGSVWIDTDWETPVYWVSRIDKHWNAIRGDWELIDSGIRYHGDDLIRMIDVCLEMI